MIDSYDAPDCYGDHEFDPADYYRMGEADHKARTRRRLIKIECWKARAEIDAAIELMMADESDTTFADLLNEIKARVDFMVMA